MEDGWDVVGLGRVDERSERRFWGRESRGSLSLVVLFSWLQLARELAQWGSDVTTVWLLTLL